MKTLDALVCKAAEQNIGVDDFVNLLLNTYDLYRRRQFERIELINSMNKAIDDLRAENETLRRHLNGC